MTVERPTPPITSAIADRGIATTSASPGASGAADHRKARRARTPRRAAAPAGGSAPALEAATRSGAIQRPRGLVAHRHLRPHEARQLVEQRGVDEGAAADHDRAAAAAGRGRLRDHRQPVSPRRTPPTTFSTRNRGAARERAVLVAQAEARRPVPRREDRAVVAHDLEDGEVPALAGSMASAAPRGVSARGRSSRARAGELAARRRLHAREPPATRRDAVAEPRRRRPLEAAGEQDEHEDQRGEQEHRRHGDDGERVEEPSPDRAARGWCRRSRLDPRVLEADAPARRPPRSPCRPGARAIAERERGQRHQDGGGAQLRLRGLCSSASRRIPDRARGRPRRARAGQSLASAGARPPARPGRAAGPGPRASRPRAAPPAGTVQTAIRRRLHRGHPETGGAEVGDHPLADHRRRHSVLDREVIATPRPAAAGRRASARAAPAGATGGIGAVALRRRPGSCGRGRPVDGGGDVAPGSRRAANAGCAGSRTSSSVAASGPGPPRPGDSPLAAIACRASPQREGVQERAAPDVAAEGARTRPVPRIGARVVGTKGPAPAPRALVIAASGAAR